MKSSPSYQLLLLILFIIAGHRAAAQDEVTRRFIDSLKTPAQVHDSVPAAYDSATADEEDVDTADAQILPDTAFTSNPRKVNADSIFRIKKDKGFYYRTWLDSLLRADETQIKNEEPPGNLPDLTIYFTIFKTVLWLLAVAVLCFVIYKLFLGKSALFIRNRTNLSAVIALAEDPAAGGYEVLIAQAVAEYNYRLAVRYRYLQCLQGLASREYIIPGTEKTNYQYISEVKKHAPRAARLFATLVLQYEYAWYGEYPVSATLYQSLELDFDELNNERN